MASIVRDDPVAHVTTGGGIWSVVFMDRFFGGSATWPAFALTASQGDTGQYGSLSMTFQGTSVAFFGNTPYASASQWAFVSIDGGPEYNSSYMDAAPPSSRQWFQSPTLPDGTHTVNISHIAGTSVDFVVITAGQSTPLLGEKLIVDDGDPSITYSDSWSLNTHEYTSRDNPVIGLPYGNATHQTSSAGASATFRFSGSTTALYGIFSFDVLGSISVTYTMDGFPVNKTYSVDASTPEYTNKVKQLENYLFYSNNSLSSGEHTLEIQITNCVSQTFELDYITYTPSFSTLASKPILSSPSSSSATASQTSSLSSIRSSNPSSTQATSTPLAGNKTNTSTSHSSSEAAVIGGTLGGVVALALLLLLFLWRRRAASRRHPLLARPFTSVFATGATKSPAASVEPFVLSSPSSVSATLGLYEDGAEKRTGKAISPLHRQSGNLPSPTLAPQAISSELLPSEAIERGTHRLSRSQVQRLQTLIQAFNREINAGSPDGVSPSFDGSRVAELHGRIAELIREDARSDIFSAGERTGSPFSQAGPLTGPPAYEARDQFDNLGQTMR